MDKYKMSRTYGQGHRFKSVQKWKKKLFHPFGEEVDNANGFSEYSGLWCQIWSQKFRICTILLFFKYYFWIWKINFREECGEKIPFRKSFGPRNIKYLYIKKISLFCVCLKIVTWIMTFVRYWRNLKMPDLRDWISTEFGFRLNTKISGNSIYRIIKLLVKYGIFHDFLIEIIHQIFLKIVINNEKL